LIEVLDLWPPAKPRISGGEPLNGQGISLEVVGLHGTLADFANGNDLDTCQPRVLAWEPAPGASKLAADLITKLWGRNPRWVVAIESAHLMSAAALSPWVIDPVAAALAELNIPLAVAATGGGNLVALYELATRLPNLRLLVRHATGCSQGLLLTLLETCPSVYMATNILQDHELTTAANLDASRLIFGSPRYRSVANEVGRIRAALSEADQAQVWAANAFDLLGCPTKSAPNEEK
jgi:hypothetical protein